MENLDWIPTGMAREEEFSVEEKHTAYHIGSGDERVLGTPWMISFMERVSNRLVSGFLSEAKMSVGFHVDVKHLSPTPVHASVRVRVEVLSTAANRVTLKVEAWDKRDKIGDGIHKRAIVDRDAFMRRVMAKNSV